MGERSAPARAVVGRALVATAFVVLSSGLAACGSQTTGADGAAGTASPGQSSDLTKRTGTDATYAVEKPGPFKPPQERADVLITATTTLPATTIAEIRRIKGVRAAVPFSLASASIEGLTLSVAAVDPAAFRNFTPDVTAQAQFVWDRVAGGEVAVDSSVPKKLIDRGDMMSLGTREDSPAVHVGAYAPLVQKRSGLKMIPAVHAVVNEKRGEQLGMPTDNALLVSTGDYTPSALMKQFKAVLGDAAGADVAIQTLALEFKNTMQTAVLTGGSVSEAVGTFSYTDGPDGTIRPDSGWISQYVRTDTVPILGQVTCNKAFLPQMQAAFAEVVQRGLADKIHPSEYAGCYYPRYIGRSPENGLSLHSWGIAFDINVPGNQRGTRGEMDRQVVEIMKKWGMAWGGDWNYTDPMHFGMNRVVQVG